MLFKRLIITVLIISHLLINCSWAAVHMPETPEPGVEPLHMQPHIQNASHTHADPSDCLHSSESGHEDDRCHVHIIYQVAQNNAVTLTLNKNSQPLYDTHNYLSLGHQPPVPPPTI